MDEEIEDQGVKIVRFADDFVILCKSERKAQKVLEHCVRVLAEHRLQLHEDGTRIVNFDRGFDFIGYLVLRTLALKKAADPAQQKQQKPIKSTVTDEGIIELDDQGSHFDPGRRVLYVLDPQHRLETRNRSFSVQRDDGSELIAIPYRRIGRIEAGPGVGFGQRPVELAIQTGVELAVVDGFGQTKGLVTSHPPKRAGLHMAQAQAVLSEPFRLEAACRLVDARIRNQRTQLLRLNRTRELQAVTDALRSMMWSLRKVPYVKTVDELLGAEGASTKAFWPCLGVLWENADVQPFQRSRPARDPLNAAINYLTGILERDTRAAIQATGLHQGFAFLHGTRDRHDGLVYDLMEPFRAPLTEGLAVYLFNANRLRQEMFSAGSDNLTVIGDEGRAAIVQGYEAAAARRANKTGEPGKLAWRPMMLHQARGLAAAVKSGDTALFRPYLMSP